MLYAELGRYPIQITIYARMIKFWNNINVIGKQSKMSYYCYQSVNLKLGRTSKWITDNHILKIFETTTKQQQLNNNFVHKTIKTNVCRNGVMTHKNSQRVETIDYLKPLFCLKILPKQNYIRLIKFRLANHKLSIETDRWENIELSERKCQKCSKNLLLVVGD